MKRGDHLVTERTGYTHHGLYLGDNEVIHYAGLSDNLDKGKIEITSYKIFSQDKNTYVKDCWMRVYNEEESIERADSRLGEDEYNVVFNNCEHFVTWCIQGISISKQVEIGKQILYEIIEREWKEKLKNEMFRKTVITGIVNEGLITQTVTSAVTSTATKTLVSNAIGTTTGVVTASTITGGTVAGISSFVAAGSVATVAAPLAIAAGVGYGVSKVIDWFWD